MKEAAAAAFVFITSRVVCFCSLTYRNSSLSERDNRAFKGAWKITKRRALCGEVFHQSTTGINAAVLATAEWMAIQMSCKVSNGLLSSVFLPSQIFVERNEKRFSGLYLYSVTGIGF
jgi:hypothetical protein